MRGMTAIDKLRQDAAGLLPQGERSIYNRTQLEEILAEVDAIILGRGALEAERDELIRISNKLRRERDEARREVCNMKDFHGLPRDYALERGWNCFEETIR